MKKYRKPKFGIDISHWQGDFDLKSAVKNEGVEFVIIKAGGGDAGIYKDSRFEENYKKAKEAGIPVGCYWFSEAYSKIDALTEAQFFVAHCLKGKQFDLPVYMDVEAGIGNNTYDNLTTFVKTWCEFVEKNGYYVGIYSNAWWFTSKMDGTKLPYTRWIASWGTSKPSDCDAWQFGGETNYIRSNKILGRVVDQNYLYVNFPDEIKSRGLNGYPKKEDEPMTEAEKKEFKALKDKVNSLEKVVDQHTVPKYGYIDKNLPAWSRKDIEKLYKKGYLKGDEKGNLQLSNDILRVLVIFARTIKD